MPIFKIWDVIKVPFPYTDRPVRQRRPALVVAAGGMQKDHGLVWALMITSAENRGWCGDVEITDLNMSGLPAPSLVRTAKIATLEAGDAGRVGSLPMADREAVTARLREAFGDVLFRAP